MRLSDPAIDLVVGELFAAEGVRVRASSRRQVQLVCRDFVRLELEAGSALDAAEERLIAVIRRG